MRSTVLAVILFLCLAPLSRAATLDTAFTFSTLETRHFSIHFHQGLEAVARKAAVFAEQAHDKVVGEFLWEPAEKTQLVLIDNSDFTNGLTVTIPYNTIYIQTVPPSLASTLGEYDDWLKTLITHEYAHVLSSDPARGYSKLTRAVFGKPLPLLGDPFTELFFLVTAPPNIFLPRWWHEGMATWSETQYTGEGRGKGTFFDMVYRTAVAENHLPRVDEINGDVPYWPDGDLPYLYGYRLQRYITDTCGQDALGKLALAHAGRFPYLISAPPEEVCGGKNYRELYDGMIAALKKEQSQKIALLSTAPFTPLTVVSRAGENLTHPRFSPDGSRIAYTRVDPHDHTSTVITDRSGKRLASFRRQLSDEGSSWSPDGGTLYFTQAEINRGFDIYQDLYAYSISGDAVTRLTRMQRLSDAEASPDGRQIAAVASSRGSQNLALIDVLVPGSKVAAPRLVTGYALQQVSSPRWSPDGKTLSYAVKDNAGHSSIRLYEPASGKDTILFSTSFIADNPVWSRDGSSIFYISDETGVFNLFAYDLKAGRSYQVSHLLTGALQPDPSPDGRSMLLSSYTSRGFQIAQMTLDRSNWSEQRGPALPLRRKLAPPVGDNPAVGAVSNTGAAGQASAQEQTASPKSAPPSNTRPGGGTREEALTASPYNALNTLYPHFWLPRISSDDQGTVFGAFTAGADVLGYNSYALSADYSPERSRGYFDLAYNNNYFYPTLSLLAHSEPFVYTDLQRRGDYWEVNQGFTVQATVPINFLESSYQFNLGYEFLDEKSLSALDSNGLFNGVPVFQGRRNNVFLGVAYDNVLRYPYSVSSEEGRRISLLYKRFGRVLGSSQDMDEYSAQYQEYLRMPWAALRHQVLYLRLSGALADGDLPFGQQAYQIGGIPSDLNPYPLRGYSVRSATGKYVTTGTAEYRLPIVNPMRGPGTLPFFLEKMHGALFVDAGEVWDDRNAFDANKVKVGAGFELRYDVTLGYWAKVTPALGVAHGFSQGGENQIYFTLYMGL